MSKTSVSRRSRRKQSTKYSPVVLNINPSTRSGRQHARDLIRAAYKFALASIGNDKSLLKIPAFAEMGWWLTIDEMVTAGVAKESELNLNVAQLGTISVATSGRTFSIDNTRYREQLRQAAKDLGIQKASGMLRGTAEFLEAVKAA